MVGDHHEIAAESESFASDDHLADILVLGEEGAICK